MLLIGARPKSGDSEEYLFPSGRRAEIDCTIYQLVRRTPMKNLWLILWGILLLMVGIDQGYQGFGASPAFGQAPSYPPYWQPPPAPYYNPDNNPPPYYNSGPYSDPLSQLLNYIVPQITGGQYQNDWQNQEREYYGHRWRRHRGCKHHEHTEHEDD